jgi:hypothetical protein
MKIEFIKEVKTGGIEIVYYTHIDGSYVEGSASNDMDRALQYYIEVRSKYIIGSKEVLKSEYVG